jgi:2Fe-2S ferredoxin
MSELVVIDRHGVESKLGSTEPSSVMEAIRNAGIGDVFGLCGGSCSCATCHVYLDFVSPEAVHLVPPVTEDEDGLLDASSHRKPTSRLSCQINTQLAPCIRVTIAPED